MKRFLTFLLSALLCCSAFFLSSCQTDPDDTTETTQEIAVVENGASDYVIVIPEASVSSSSVMNAVVNLKTKIRTVTGVRIDSVSDRYSRDEAEGKKLILLGYTNYDETAAITQKLTRTTCDEFIIDSVNDTIVILASYDYALGSAVQYYMDNLMESNYNAETRTLLFKGYHNPGELTIPTQFDPSKIGVYSIVYATEMPGFQTAAENLQAAISETTGIELPIQKDTGSSASPFEILVGKTNRSISKNSYGNRSFLMEYQMDVVGGVLQMTSGGLFSALKCVSAFQSNILTGTEALSDGTYYYKDLASDNVSSVVADAAKNCTYTDLGADAVNLTEGADVRIMSANVLASRWVKVSNVLPISQRSEILARMLLKYQPDVVGLQEADDDWFDMLGYFTTVMAENEGVHYTHLHGKYSVDGLTLINYSSILYRSDKYQVDESGCRVFDANSNYMTAFLQRVGTYAKFTSLTDSTKQFAIINSHWAHETDDAIYSCVNEEALLVSYFKDKYPDIPIFCTADYNCDPSKEPTEESTGKNRAMYFIEFRQLISGISADRVAFDNGTLLVDGGCHWSTNKMYEDVPRLFNPVYLDHIVCTGGYYGVLRHDTIFNRDYSHIMTDHQPIYADISLTNPNT